MNKRIRICIWIIVVLSFLQGALLLGARPMPVDPENVGLVDQLRSDIDLIYTVSGVIITALSVTVGVLWHALRASQAEFIKTLKELAKKE